MSDILAILVSFNTKELTRKALNLLLSSMHDLEMEVLVIDNASRDDSVQMLRTEYPEVTLIENSKNVGFGRANNQALPFVKSRYVLLINTDAFVAPDSIAKTVRYMDEHPQCGILGVRLIGREGELQPSCRYFPTPWNIFLLRTGLCTYIEEATMVDDMNWDDSVVRDCDWVPGCYFLIRKEVIDQVGLFDPRYFLYYEEVDLCYAAKMAGWKVTYFPDTTVVHLGGESAKRESEISSRSRQIEALNIESELLYFRKNHGVPGVLHHLLLNSLADLIQLLKDIVKLRTPAKIFFNLRRSMFVWGTYFRTYLATEPTR
jgi:N-acetylglucosaminyl-diphospho-decaprenol L-rhamnosyltransferase